MASQFGSRLLRIFMRDHTNQRVPGHVFGALIDPDRQGIRLRGEKLELKLKTIGI
jgi:hypothetical protein